jgi:hypothetical protein
MIQAPTLGTFVVSNRFIPGSDWGACDGVKEVDGTLRFDNVSCFSGLCVVAYALVDMIDITPGTEQSLAVRTKTPVVFLPVLYVIRQRWDIEDAAIGIA